MNAQGVEPIRKRLLVNASQEECFRTFVERQDEWFPKTYRLGKAEKRRTVLEGRPGGRWYEVGVDGVECDWGRVLAWDPPKRLVIAWRINAEWKYDPALATEIEARFVPDGPDKTWLEFEHRHLDRLGADAERAKAQMEGGWNGLLALFSKFAASRGSHVR